MQRWLFLPILALLCLPITDLLRAQQPASGDKKDEALKKLEALTKDLDALEQQLTKERIVARSNLIEKEGTVRSLERQRRMKLVTIEAERSKLEALLREIESKARPDAGNKIKEEVHKKLADLMLDEERLAVEDVEAQKVLMEAEEKLKLLERKQDNQRHLANLRLELVEQELFGKSDAGVRRKLEKLEKGMESIQRDLEDLRRKIGAKDAP